MQLNIYTTFSDELKQDWDALLEKSITNTPFLRFDYLKTWWQTRGGGEWPQADLCIVTARNEGELLGIAPLFVTPDHNGQTALMLLGSIEVSDYLDVLAEPQHLDEFLAALLPFLQQNVTGWNRLDWYNIIESSPTVVALKKFAGENGWVFQEERYQPSPYISLPGNWDAYLAGIDKKQRHEIRRKMRRLENAEIASRWYTVGDTEDLQNEIDDFLFLMEQEGDKAQFLIPDMRDHMRLTIRCFHELGFLHLSFLEIDGQKAAAKLCFDYENQLLAYNSGIDRRFMEYSPGWVLLGYVLEWANREKRAVFDFMRGDEEYKYRFGAVDRFVMRLVMTPGPPR